MDSPMVRVTRDSVANLIAMLGDEDDEKLKLDMLEGETPLFDVIRTLLEGNESDEGQIAALDAQIAARTVRKERAELRIQQRKNLIQSLLDTAGLTKVPLPEATIWTSKIAPGWKVDDVEALPEGFYTEDTIIKRKPDRAIIEGAVSEGHIPPGVITTNGGTRLNIRRK